MPAGSIALQGEMGSVASVARNISQLDTLQETMTWLRTGIGYVQSAGEAQALTALLAACRPLESRARQIANAKVSAGQALQHYADQVSAMQQEARFLRAKKTAAESARAQTVNRIADIDSDADDAAAQTHRLNTALGEADSTLRMIEQQLTELDQARLRADSRCAAAIDACTAALNAVDSQPTGGFGRGDGEKKIPVRSWNRSDLLTTLMAADGKTIQRLREIMDAFSEGRGSPKAVADLNDYELQLLLALGLATDPAAEWKMLAAIDRDTLDRLRERV